MSGCRRMASTASLSPCTTLKTPSGSPASFSNSAIRTLADGSFSDGFSTNVFPHARAIGNIQSGTITGKLNGVIPAHTPRGCRRECASTPRPTDPACSPLSRWGAPAANSITSMPRCTDPAASRRTFPCSSVTMLASSVWCCSMSSRNRVRMRARRRGGVDLHAGNAATAARTARSTSSPPAKGTVRVTSPVAGLVTLPLLVLRGPTRRPSIQKGTEAAVATLCEGSGLSTPAGIERFLVRSECECGMRTTRQHINIVPPLDAQLGVRVPLGR